MPQTGSCGALVVDAGPNRLSAIEQTEHSVLVIEIQR